MTTVAKIEAVGGMEDRLGHIEAAAAIKGAVQKRLTVAEMQLEACRNAVKGLKKEVEAADKDLMDAVGGQYALPYPADADADAENPPGDKDHWRSVRLADLEDWPDGKISAGKIESLEKAGVATMGDVVDYCEKHPNRGLTAIEGIGKGANERISGACAAWHQRFKPDGSPQGPAAADAPDVGTFPAATDDDTDAPPVTEWAPGDTCGWQDADGAEHIGTIAGFAASGDAVVKEDATGVVRPLNIDRLIDLAEESAPQTSPITVAHLLVEDSQEAACALIRRCDRVSVIASALAQVDGSGWRGKALAERLRVLQESDGDGAAVDEREAGE